MGEQFKEIHQNRKSSKLCWDEILIFTLVFIFSYALLFFYITGDQFHYRGFYQAINNLPIFEIKTVMQSRLGASEVLSGIILWIGSNLGIEKNTYISLLNSILALGFYKLCKKNNASKLFIFLLMTNFYIIVLYTSAERLKIAFIFIVYGLLVSGRAGRIIFFASAFAHLQSLILFFSIFFNKLVHFSLRVSKNKKVNKYILFNVIFFIVLSLGFILVFGEVLISKVYYYHDYSQGVTESFRMLGLIVLSFLVFRWNVNFIMYCIPVFILIFIVGSSRVNMIAVFIFLHYVLMKNKSNNFFVLLLLLYFSYASIEFISNIFNYGTGFYYVD